MRIALTGPCAPAHVAELLGERDATVARSMSGFPGVQVSELAKGLVNAGQEVTVVTAEPSLHRPTVELSGPRFRLVVQRSRLRPRDYLRDFYALERREMARILRDESPDIVHSHWTYEYELAAQEAGLTHVTTARDSPWAILRHVPDAYRLARLGVALRARPGIEHLLVASPYMATAWRRHMRYKRPIELIPNMTPMLPRPDKAKAPVPTAICVADSSPRKNVGVLVSAFAQVRTRVPSATLRVAGFGLAASDALPRKWISKGLGEGVEFMGHLSREALSSEISAAWTLVHPSLEESFGNTLVEALALGTPVIAGRESGAIPWVLGFGVAGQLIDVRSSGVVADVLAKALDCGPVDPPPAARELISCRYAPESVVEAHLRYYQRHVRS